MPIDYQIDHARRLVVARGRGVFAESDMFAYQREVWSHPEVEGYDELVDMTHVEAIAVPQPTAPGMRKLAALAGSQDPPAGIAKFAIVAPDPLAFGLGRQYQAYRELDPQSTKTVGVFRTMDEALSFLGIEGLQGPQPGGNEA
jgi:hypothetical protein